MFEWLGFGVFANVLAANVAARRIIAANKRSAARAAALPDGAGEVSAQIVIGGDDKAKAQLMCDVLNAAKCQETQQ